MQCIQEVLLEPTNYTGSENTHAIIAQQIRERFGEEAEKDYDPLTNCRTFRSWLALGCTCLKRREGAEISYLCGKGR